jgi:hypothetical protein
MLIEHDIGMARNNSCSSFVAFGVDPFSHSRDFPSYLRLKVEELP